MNILSSPTTAYLRWSLENNTTNYQKTMEQLASGYKINSCREDVLTYKKAAIIDSKISQNSVFENNIKYGNDVLEVLASTENNVLSQISTIRDLCLQVSNETYSSEERNSILTDIRSRLDYLDYVAANTTFNGKNILDGSCSEYRIQIASDEYVNIADAMTDVHAAALGIDIDASVTGDTWTTADIENYILKLDAAEASLLNYETLAGSFSMGLDNTLDLKEAANEALTATKSDLVDTDYSSAVSELIKHKLLQECSINMEVSYNQLAGQTFNLLYPRS